MGKGVRVLREMSEGKKAFLAVAIVCLFEFGGFQLFKLAFQGIKGFAERAVVNDVLSFVNYACEFILGLCLIRAFGLPMKPANGNLSGSQVVKYILIALSIGCGTVILDSLCSTGLRELFTLPLSELSPLQKHQSVALYTMPLPIKILIVVVVAPITEELIYRAFLTQQCHVG
jgi:membrane protease YdiL (CAAX protease family)